MSDKALPHNVAYLVAHAGAVRIRGIREIRRNYDAETGRYEVFVFSKRRESRKRSYKEILTDYRFLYEDEATRDADFLILSSPQKRRDSAAKAIVLQDQFPHERNVKVYSYIVA